MKARPILFSAPMVRAILEGRKTMTRRVMNPTGTVDSFVFNSPAFTRYKYTKMWRDLEDRYCAYFETDPESGAKYGFAESFECPYGQPGDRLWVRETFFEEPDGRVYYRAGYPAYESWVTGTVCVNWRPSIFMPRALSRILLEVTAVRVERVQDISQDDARREGIDPSHAGYCLGAFKRLWDSINSKRGYGWDANPFVWVVEFKPIVYVKGES